MLNEHWKQNITEYASACSPHHKTEKVMWPAQYDMMPKFLLKQSEYNTEMSTEKMDLI